jgi:hypothetical protein
MLLPRSNKAASLRAAGNPDPSDAQINEHGVYVRPATGSRVAQSTSERGKGPWFENTPGYKRQTLAVSVAALKLPAIVPRQTNSSSLRQGKPVVRRDSDAAVQGESTTSW